MDKKLLRLIWIVVGLIVLVILLSVLSNAITGGKKRNYDEVVEEFVSATKSYLADNPERKPTSANPVTMVNYNFLVEEKYMKSASDLFKNKNASCYGDVSVYYLETEKFDYVPDLTCNVDGVNSTAKNLSNTIIGDGEINVVTNGSGLYKRINSKWILNEEEISSGASDDNVEYYFRGNEPSYLNNYVKIDDMLFRVVMVDNYGNMLMIYDESLKTNFPWDRRYNMEINKAQGINTYVENGVKSAAMEKVESFIEGKEKLENKVPFSESLKYIVEDFDVCIGKRFRDDEGADGSIECKTKISNQKVTLLPAYMFMSASLDPTCLKTVDKSCGNNNYLSNYSGYWILTSEGDRSNYCFYINYSISPTICSTNGAFKPLINVSSRVQYSAGTGTHDDPYILYTGNYVEAKK